MTSLRLSLPRFAATCGAALLLASCSGSDSPTDNPPPTPQPTVGSVAVLTAAAPQVVGATVTVEVRVDSNTGQPMANQSVAFSATAGTVSPATATTNAQGRASVTWTLGTTAGSQTLTATASGRSGTFVVSAAPGAAAAFEKVSGDAQTGAAGEPLGETVVVTVKDGFGNARSGESLTVAVSTGGGSTPSATATTGTDGRASIAWVLGEALGQNTLTVTHALGAVVFTATARPGAPASVSVVSGDAQNGTAGAELADALVVEVADRLGHKVPGARVAFVPAEGAGSAAPDTALTGEDGRASARWTLGGKAGAQSLAARAGDAPAAAFQATAAPGAPTELKIVSGDAQEGPVAKALAAPVVVEVLDAFGNGVAGKAVTFATANAGGTVAPAQAASGADGRASAAWTLGTVAGAQALTASSEGLAPVAFSARALPGAAAEVRVVSGNAQSDTVGKKLAQPLVAEVVDAFDNPVPGAQVAFAPSGGTVDPAAAATGENGRASTSWTLGTTSGTPTVTAAVAGATPATCSATALPGPAATGERVSGDGQTGPAQSPLAAPLVVRAKDTFGNGVPGVAVTFSVTAGGGSVAPTPTATGADGTASATFTLGATVGEHKAQASAGALGTVDFTATATSGPPAAMSKVSGDAQSRTVGDTVSVTVEVVDAFGNKVPNAAVVFSVASGGGSVAIPAPAGVDGPWTASEATAQTDATGRARAVWTLGTTAGAQTLGAAVSGAGSVTFSATGRAGAPASLTKVAGDGQTATAGTAVATAPRVKVADAFGNGVSGVAITFAVASGGGSATGTTPTTGSDGTAAVGSWTLGATAGANSLTASATGLTTVTFTATGSPAATPGFDIEIRIIGSMSSAVQNAFATAEARWEQIITGDIPNASLSASQASQCGNAPAEALSVDDVVIFAEVVAIDGPGGTLGSAGPCWIRGGSQLPIQGSMRFDEADLANMISDGSLGDVILHEMGHVLGIGTLWDNLSLLQGEGSADPFYSGAEGLAAFQSMGGTVVNGVPVENTGGEGTRDGHWRETVFQTELMTGYLSGSVNPLSILTVRSLIDLGYTVNVGAADGYALPAPGPVGQQAPAPLMNPKWEILLKPLGTVGGGDG